MTIRIPHLTVVLVCDGAKAVFYRNAGDAIDIDLAALEVAMEPHPSTHELGSERPGRVHESIGASRSAVEAPDYHDAAETAFLEMLGGRLDRLVRDDGVKHLIVAAPPRALGVLRKHYSPTVKAALLTEMNKDLTRIPTGEIEAALKALGELPP